MQAMTKAQLHEALRASGVMFRTKAPKAELEQLVADSSIPKRKKPRSAKAKLRHKFERRGYVTSKQIEQIATTLNVQPATIFTAMTDLKNAKYAGKAGPLKIQKDDDGTYRLVQ